MALKITKKLEILERRRLVWANLKAGATYREIARVLEVSLRTVWKDVQVVQKQLQEETIQDAKYWKQLRLARLNTLLNAIWDSATKGHLGAVDRFLALDERIAKVMGLDQPEEHHLTLDLTELSDDQLDKLEGGLERLDRLIERSKETGAAESGE